MGWACGTYGKTRDACTVLVGKPEGKRQLGKPKGLWRNNIKMNLKEIYCVRGVDWIDQAQNRDKL